MRHNKICELKNISITLSKIKHFDLFLSLPPHSNDNGRKATVREFAVQAKKLAKHFVVDNSK